MQNMQGSRRVYVDEISEKYLKKVLILHLRQKRVS